MSNEQPPTQEQEIFSNICHKIVVASWPSFIADTIRYNLIRELFLYVEEQRPIWSIHPELNQLITPLYEQRYRYTDTDQPPEDHDEMLQFLNNLRTQE
jgi:hypothetical protein